MRSQEKLPYRIATLIGAATSAFVLAIAFGVAPAQAHGSGHSSRSCGSTHYVLTQSISAGYTLHHKKISGSWYHDDTWVPPSSNGYWSWGGPNLPSSVQDWGVTADVLESHSTACYPKPV